MFGSWLFVVLLLPLIGHADTGVTTYSCVGIYTSSSSAHAACMAAKGAGGVCTSVGAGFGCPVPAALSSFCYDADDNPSQYPHDYQCYGYMSPPGCPAGTTIDGDGKCVPIQCGPGQHYSPEYEQCVDDDCPPGQVDLDPYTPGPQCGEPPQECPDGELVHPVTGECMVPPSCPAGFYDIDPDPWSTNCISRRFSREWIETVYKTHRPTLLQ